MLRPEHLDALLEPMARPEVEVATLSTPCAAELIHNPNAVKVVTTADGRALYFSRAAIPFDRDGVGNFPYQKHLGIYAYRKSALDRFPKLPPSRLEAIERLEQLRFLENGIDVYVTSTPFDTIGVDTEEDLRAVEQLLRNQQDR
jgi:3-deoxy-manno-octulosonate cytidylyltransferase (CMP-KDO synthetase)